MHRHGRRLRVISSQLYPEAIISDGRHNGLRAVAARGIVDALRKVLLRIVIISFHEVGIGHW